MLIYDSLREDLDFEPFISFKFPCLIPFHVFGFIFNHNFFFSSSFSAYWEHALYEKNSIQESTRTCHIAWGKQIKSPPPKKKKEKEKGRVMWYLLFSCYKIYNNNEWIQQHILPATTSCFLYQNQGKYIKNRNKRINCFFPFYKILTFGWYRDNNNNNYVYSSEPKKRKKKLYNKSVVILYVYFIYRNPQHN